VSDLYFASVGALHTLLLSAPRALQDSLSTSLPKDGSVAVFNVFKVSDTATLTDLMKAVETGDMDKTLKELGHLLGGETDVSVLLPLLCWPVFPQPQR
jgi:hypothetical protein